MSKSGADMRRAVPYDPESSPLVGRKTPSACKYSMNCAVSGIVVALGDTLRKVGYQEGKAHASTALLVSGGNRGASDSVSELRSVVSMSACDWRWIVGGDSPGMVLAKGCRLADLLRTDTITGRSPSNATREMTVPRDVR